MKPQELRIGNWINFDGKDCMVAEISSDVVYDEHDELPYLIYKHCLPINLTEEWLLKFGFEIVKDLDGRRDNYIYYWHDEYKICIVKDKDYDGYLLKDFMFAWGEKRVRYKYVHELQNLVHGILGVELIIK